MYTHALTIPVLHLQCLKVPSGAVFIEGWKHQRVIDTVDQLTQVIGTIVLDQHDTTPTGVMADTKALV